MTEHADNERDAVGLQVAEKDLTAIFDLVNAHIVLTARGTLDQVGEPHLCAECRGLKADFVDIWSREESSVCQAEKLSPPGASLVVVSGLDARWRGIESYDHCSRRFRPDVPECEDLLAHPVDFDLIRLHVLSNPYLRLTLWTVGLTCSGSRVAWLTPGCLPSPLSVAAAMIRRQDHLFGSRPFVARWMPSLDSWRAWMHPSY